MLAALLLNLGGTPPPPPVVAQQFFGGGPFWKRYGYDPRYYKQDEEVELSQPQEEVIEAAIERAVDAIRQEPKPQAIVLDSKRIYERVFEEVRGIERERVREIWRAEIKRRLQQQDEMELICLMFL